MALQYVGGASGTGTGATYSVSLTSLTGGIGSSAAAGDIVIVVTGWASTTDDNPGVTTAGYTELADLYSNDTNDANLSVSYKLMGGTPDTSVTVSGPNSATNGGATVVHVWRGVHQTTPIDVTTTTASAQINGANANAPAITPVTAGAVVIACGGGTGPTTQAAPSATPSGLFNQVAVNGDGSTRDFYAVVASAAWTSGALDPATWTAGTSSTSESWAAATVALRPKNAGTSTIITDFTSGSGVWTTDVSGAGATATVTGGVAQVSVDQTINQYAHFWANSTFYDLTSDSFFLKVPTYFTSAGTGTEQGFGISQTWGSNYLGWSAREDGTLQAYYRTGGVITAAYSVAAGWTRDTYRWLRVRESGGTVFWDSAPSTASNPPVSGDWVNRGSATLATIGYAVDAVVATLFIRNIAANTSAASYIGEFDGINTATAQSTDVALTGQSMTASRGTLPPVSAVTLAGQSTTASRGSMFGREANGDAPEAAFSATQSGFWMEPRPVGRFETTSSSGTRVTAYNTTSAGANVWGRWRDRSGYGRDAVSGASGTYPFFKNGWRYTAEVADRATIANGGGSTSAFYIALAFAPYNYYGTLFSDLGTVGANVGFRLHHDGDGNGTIPQYIFSAGNGTSRIEVRIDAGHTLFANPPANTPLILEAWYDGSNLFLSKDGAAPTQSASTVTVSAGSSTAVLNAITPATATGDDVMNGGTEYYEVISVKNAVPDSTTRNAIRAYLTTQITDPAAGITLAGKTVTPSGGTLVPASAVTLAGNAVTASRGALAPSNALTLTGQSASASRGTLTPSNVAALTGQATAASSGSLSAASGFSVVLTGQQVTTVRGTLGSASTVSVAGQQVFVARGTVSAGADRTVALSGMSLTAAKGSPKVGTRPGFGVNLHDGSDAATNTAIADALAYRQLHHKVRFDLVWDGGQTNNRDLASKIIARGGSVQGSLQVAYQWDWNYWGSDLTAVHDGAYTQTYNFVNANKDVFTDYELLNEVQWRSEIVVDAPNGDQMESTTAYESSVGCLRLASCLKGMADAIHDLRASSGLPLRVIMGFVGRDWGFATFLRNHGVDWDVTGFHAYPRNDQALISTDTWYGNGINVFARMAQLGRPVTYNEFNAGEVYNTTYTNVEGNTDVEQGMLSVNKNINAMMAQAYCDLESLTMYELFDRVPDTTSENRFGLIHGTTITDPPKTTLYIVTAYAGGTLTSTERAEITTERTLLTNAQIDALMVNKDVSLTGQSATVARGTLTPSTAASPSVALTGQAITASRGSVAPVNAISLTGQGISVSAGLLSSGMATTITLAGQSVTLTRGLPTAYLGLNLDGSAIIAAISSASASATSNQLWIKVQDTAGAWTEVSGPETVWTTV